MGQLKSASSIFFIVLLDREEGKERERETLIGCLHMGSKRGSNLYPKYFLWLQIKPATFWFTERRSNKLSHTSQGKKGKF